MDKRFSQRKSGKFLAAAVATVGLAGLTQQADASLVIDVRATGISHDGGVSVQAVADPKNLVVSQNDIVYLGVVARISGANATQVNANNDGTVPVDTRNDDSAQIVTGSFRSIGLLKGNYDPTNTGPAGATGVPSDPNEFKGPAPVAVGPFGGAGSNSGATSDFDGDGDLDIGSTGTDPTPMWSGRSSGQTYTLVSKKNPGPVTALGWWTANTTGGGTAFAPDGGGPNSGKPQTALIDATTSEQLLAEFAWVVTGSSGVAALNFVPRPANDAGAATWFEDGSPTAKNPGTGSFTAGTPVNVAVPEPTALGLLGIAGLGLLARRRNKDENA